MNRWSKTLSKWNRARGLLIALVAITFLTIAIPGQALAQEQDDPPARVARLGYTEGSVSFQPAGESEWVQAAPNRPMTTGDKLWADRDSRAEVQLGPVTIHLAANTGFSFLNLDDRTVQIQLSSGTIDMRVRGLGRDDVFEVDTPNQAFTVYRPGRYRVEASEDGRYTVVTVRDGEGESTGNGQSYSLHAGQRTTFSGTSSLNAEVEQIGSPDDFDNWSYARERRYDDSPSARYVSRDMVGFDDLDGNGDWRDSGQYGHVWFPRVSVGWAPYHEGHWVWIDPWGWTWVDDDSWGYAPFHYGRWAFVENRWGWIPGPMDVAPVYAPALVVFVSGSFSGGADVAWFPLGPREVYVPSYPVSQAYVTRVNVSNTTVNTTTVTNVYNATIFNKSTTITNVNYVNRNLQGAVTAVPQRVFASAQPVAKAAVAVNAQQLSAAPVSTRAAVPPAREAVLGAHANSAGHVAAPPQAVASRAVIAKAAPPPPPPSFAARQQALAKNPGQPVPRREMAKLAPANATTAALVKRAPPAKPATAKPATNQPGNRPSNPPANNERPGATPSPAGRPQPENQPAPNEHPEPNRPEPNQPAPNTSPEKNRPAEPPAPNDRPPAAQPNNRPEPNRPEANRPEPIRPEPARPETKHPPEQPTGNRPGNPPTSNERPGATPSPAGRPQPGNQPAPNEHPEPNRPEPNQPAPNNRPEPNRPEANRPEPIRPEPDRPETKHPPEQPPNQLPPPAERQQQSTPPPEARPAPQQHQQPKAQTPEEKKRQDEQRKQDEQKPQ